ncbi:MAG: YicC family protein [Phycisphaerae bacterium]|nr:YicC family protein [Phycisphaerae bacterium]
MIRSMTGFGSATSIVDGRHFSVEIRSLNGKHLKCHVRLPEDLLGLEPELEAIVAGAIRRGTITMTVRFQDRSSNAAAEINHEALDRYMKQVSEIEGVNMDAGSLLHLPGVLVHGTGEDARAEALNELKKLAGNACAAVNTMRVEEGKALESDLGDHLKRIAGDLEHIESRVPEVNELYSERLKSRMSSMLGELGKEVREEDLIREVAIFAEKSDIAEEVSRLHGHLDQFRELVSQEASSPVGRTLDFITQEMLREANTMASKCLDPVVSKHVVSIKGAVDRIKEQVQNVE